MLEDRPTPQPVPDPVPARRLADRAADRASAASRIPGPRLPPLPFGNRHAQPDDDPAAMSRLLSSSTESDLIHEPVGPRGEFAWMGTRAQVGGLNLAAVASTAVQVQVRQAATATLIVPFQGTFRSMFGTLMLEWSAPDSAMMLPPRPRQGQDTLRSALWIDLDPARLEATARAMLALDGGDGEAPVLAFDNPLKLALRAGRVDFCGVFRHLCSVVDEYDDAPELLLRGGLDEAFCRAVVMLLAPHRFLRPLGSDEERRFASHATLARVCDHVRAHLDSRLTMTDLERFSGLSARALQYAFQRRHGCSPQQWILEQKLLAAHAQLRAPEEGTTVTEVGVRFFSNLGRFAQRYRERFGELPLATLARARGQRP